MFVIFEIPSGAVADLLGRKKTVIIGCFALALAALATGASSTYPQVFASFFLWALGFSLISGADEALLYDRLQDDKIYSQVIGRAHFWALLGAALAGIAGPYLYSLNFRYAYLSSALPFFLGGLVLVFFEERMDKHAFTLRGHVERMREGIRLAYQSKYILWAIGIMSLGFGIAYTFSNSYQPYLQNIGFSIRAFSVILPLMFVTEALGGAASGKLYNYFGEKRIFAASVLAIAVCVAVLGFAPKQPIISVLLVYTFLQGILRPMVSMYSNRYIAPANRATVISVQGMIATVTAALMLFLFGFLTDRVGLNNLLIVLGGLALVIGTLLLFLKPRDVITKTI